MKVHNILRGLLLLLTVNSYAVPSDGAGIDISVQKHSEKLITLDVQGELNIAALNSEKGIVVFDTTVSPVLAKMVRKRIEKEFGRNDFAYVINTHFHGDHTYGNQIFSDVPIIGHENCAKGMKERERARESLPARNKAAVQQMRGRLEKMEMESDGAKALSRLIPYYEAMIEGLGEGFVLSPPTMTFSDNLSLDLGDLHLELSFFGTSHSNTDIIIFCPEEGLWVTGDIFAKGYDPYIDSERLTYLDRWIDNVEKMLETEEKSPLIVPGHREFLSFDDLREHLGFVYDTRDKYAGKESAFTLFKDIYGESDLDTALEALKEMKFQEHKYYVLFPEIDQYAYYMMLDNKLDDALSIFKVLADLFPESDTAFDSLGEVYMRKKNTEMAIESFKKALELNPDNKNAVAKLKELQKKSA